MQSPRERLQEKLAEIALKKSEQKLRDLCESYDGIKCTESKPKINGITPEAYSSPFAPIASIPLAQIRSSMDHGQHCDWMRQQLQLLGEGATFFVAAPGEHPGWVGISCQKGPEKLVEFAVGLSIRYDLSLYNPSTGVGIYLQLREYETFCFKRSIGQEIK